jgi:TRAP transporter TAXI family solute receptor
MRLPLIKVLRNWITWLMVVVLVISLAVAWFTRDTMPDEILIGTAVEGGVYHAEGVRIAEILEEATGHRVLPETSSGSQENARRLRDREIQVAIVQAGSVSLDKLAVVTPLHRDVVHVLVRKELNVESVADLAGRHVIVGLQGSGMRSSARDILSHYGVSNEDDRWHEIHFTELLLDVDMKYAAAIVTTGVENESLREVLDSGEFDLLPLDADALSQRYVHFTRFDVPKNLWPPLPTEDTPTVTTTALLVVHEEASPLLVEYLLESIYKGDIPEQFPAIFSQRQAAEMLPARLHPLTRRYHDPYGQYGTMQNVLESLAAGKELVVALVAAMFLLWDRWRRLKLLEEQKRMKYQKEHLDRFLSQTLRIERSQMDTTSIDQLQTFLDEVTEIKLQALNELTNEDLRGDRSFAIFLMQCANLINKIQLKIIHQSRDAGE